MRLNSKRSKAIGITTRVGSASMHRHGGISGKVHGYAGFLKRPGWIVAFLLLALVAGCGRWDETVIPIVTATTPANTATAVPVNSTVSATFNKVMDPATINTATFTLSGPGATPVLGTLTSVGQTATFTPVGNLLGNTTYTATISTGAKDQQGNALARSFTWTFTTAADIIPPTVTATTPVNGATGVPINSKVTVTFSEAMAPASIITPATTFTLTGPGAVQIPGTVTFLGTTATFTPSSNLPAGTSFTATVSPGATDPAGNPLAAAFIWTFTTAASPDTTAPTVTSTTPVNAAVAVPINSKLSATFSEPMDPSTINPATFTVTGPGATAVSGVVTYLGNIATFTPASTLAANTLFTATITTGAKDLAGNALAGNLVWRFTTSAAVDVTPPTVISTFPADAATGVAINQAVSATFSEAMDPSTITAANFRLTGPLATPVLGTISYNVPTNIATFTPTANLAANTLFTATINGGVGGVKDLAGNPLASNKVWTFTTGTLSLPTVPPVALGAAAPFGGIGGNAGLTNQGIFTVINGDIGTTAAASLITGFHDVANVYTETPLNVGLVNGTIYAAPPAPGTAAKATTATLALASAQTAFNNLSPGLLPGGTDPFAGQLGGKTVFPGVYKAAGGSFQITGSDLTLDGQGDANAVWVFQMASTLTVGAAGAPRSVILINGAQAKNVFWQVGSAATINAAGGGTMVGTIISSAGIAFSTAGNVTITTLNGRALALTASVTMVNTHINVPAP
jgi:hypothetical protein